MIPFNITNTREDKKAKKKKIEIEEQKYDMDLVTLAFFDSAGFEATTVKKTPTMKKTQQKQRKKNQLKQRARRDF